MWIQAGMAATLVLALAGCAEATGSGVEADSGAVHVVVIGDSLIDPANGCPQGCQGFAEQFADQVASQLGTETELQTVVAMGVPDAVEVVSKPGADADTIAAADVIVLEVGFNNALPDPETGIGCSTWFLDTEPECLQEGVDTYGDLYEQVFAGLKALRGDKPTVFVVTTTINGNIVPAEAFPDGLLALDREGTGEMKAWAVAAYDRWNAMLSERATTAGFQIVDLYHAFNGVDGTVSDYPEFTDDGAHPNQAGNDLIAEKLAVVDLSPIDT